VKAAERDGVVRMPADQVESPTYTVHLTRAIADLIAAGAYGSYHVANSGACTRAAFAEFVLKCAGRAETVDIVDAVGTRIAKRPRRAVLACRIFRLVAGRPMPSWQDAVREYFERERQGI
jgi:dTDP-4-dehydrorhamnose reductase